MLIRKPSPPEEACTSVPSGSVAVLTEVLHSGNAADCIQHLSQLEDMPEPCRSVALARLEMEQDGRLQQTLLNHLIPGLKEDELVWLMTLLQSSNASLRNQVIDGLAQIRDGRLAETLSMKLTEQLHAPDPDVRVLTLNLVAALHWQSLADTVGLIVSEDCDLNVCMTAVETLLVLDARQQWPRIAGLVERFPDRPFVQFTLDQARRAWSLPAI